MTNHVIEAVVGVAAVGFANKVSDGKVVKMAGKTVAKVGGAKKVGGYFQSVFAQYKADFMVGYNEVAKK